MIALAAAAAVSIGGFVLTQVNGEVVRVAPGGTHPLCQAIPVTQLGATLRRATGRTVAVRVTLTHGRHRTSARTVRLTRARTTVTWTPHSLGLRDFTEGRYVVTVTRGGRRAARGSMTLTGGRTC